MSLYQELKSNLSYYKLNSNWNDPIFQKSLKAFSDFIHSRPSYNFTPVDTYIIVDSSPILEYGNISCNTFSKQAFVDSSLTCFLFQFPFFLESINFGYISMAFVIPIMLISIFGGIKESYRWYFLNQAIWDLFITYDFICTNPTIIGWFQPKYAKTNTCFYYITNESFYKIFIIFGGTFRDVIRYGTFIPLFLLAFSRFIALYFPLFYKRVFSKRLTTIVFITIFNIFCILIIGFRRIIVIILASLVTTLSGDCFKSFCTTPSTNNLYNCLLNDEKYFQCINRVEKLSVDWQDRVKNIPYIFPPIMFFFTCIFSSMIFLKILCQLKNQIKNNQQNSFSNTLKISSVIGFQCFTMSIIFIVFLAQMYLQNLVLINYEYFIYKSIPPWLFFLQYHTTLTCLNVIRVFLDSLIVLTVLRGYSECIIQCFKFFITCVTKPKQAVTKLNANFRKNNSTTIMFIKTSKNIP